MQSNRKRVRKDFAPLTMAVSLKCTTFASPTTQVLNGGNNEYEPDRELTPEVVANATDGSWPNPYSNAELADMRWFVNGKNISTLSDWAGKYTIEQNGSMRGAISISKNISPGQQVQLHFEAVLADPRLGVNIPVVTDPIPLSTIEKADDGYSISIGDSSIIQYDPMKDRLALYEYKVAQGLMAASAAAEAAATDKCAYRHEIPIDVMHGKTKITTGYTLKLYRVNSVTSLTELKAGQEEVEAFTPTSVVLDLRLIAKSTYIVKAFVGSKEVAMVQFGVNRIFQKYTISPTNGTDIHPADTERIDQAMVDCDGNIVECPGSILRIVWYTDTEAKKGVKHNEGDTTLFQLAKTGIGNTYADSWMETYTEDCYKDEYKFATEGADYWTDASGNRYIFN